jgi:4-diphosphocytidyl-2C-methyl-D-erythritol kinase
VICVQVPFKSTKQSDGFLEYKAETDARAAQQRIAVREAELRSMLGSGAGPFSFCERDAQRQRRKAEMQEAHRKDINRFQVRIVQYLRTVGF